MAVGRIPPPVDPVGSHLAQHAIAGAGGKQQRPVTLLLGQQVVVATHEGALALAAELIGQLSVAIEAQVPVAATGLPGQLVLGVVLVMNAG